MRHLRLTRSGHSASASGFSFTATVLASALLISLLTTFSPNALRWFSGYPAIWPQGWAFFTASPQADTPVAYRLGPNGELVVATEPLSAASNLRGVRRTGYTRLLETVHLSAAVPPEYWRRCDNVPARDCLAAARPPVYRTATPVRPAVLCGLVVVAAEHPIRSEATRRANSIALVDVTC